jgi:hypothetical protein
LPFLGLPMTTGIFIAWTHSFNPTNRQKAHFDFPEDGMLFGMRAERKPIFLMIHGMEFAEIYR